jgi:hypothetical protein
MTAVGKILVFLNLVFSLVVGAFVVMIYVARTHWVDEYKKLQAQVAVLQASAQTYQNEATKAQTDAATLVKRKDEELKGVQQDLLTAQNTVEQLRDDLGKAQTKGNQQNSLASKSVSEVEKRQEDVSKLRETLRKEQETNSTLVKRNAELVNEATVAQIERRATQDLANRVEAELQRVQGEMARMRANGGTTRVARGNGKNPPTESVEGLVKNTDSSGLMTISIGSDAGLTKGHTLELYRVNTASPTQSRYLGTIRILEADAHQAVAQPLGRLTAPPRPGDIVASRILGGGG